MYKTEDCGLFIGLMTMPFGKEEQFLERDVNRIFKAHRDQVRAACLQNTGTQAEKEFDQMLYRPKAYGLFGSFDIAVFALVDDFSLATRYFHPYSPMAKADSDHYSSNFAFNVISGICPDLSCIDDSEKPLLERMRPILDGKGAPFVGITSLKINNALLVGTGGKLVDLILRKIQQILSRHQKQAPELSYLVNHSFSWHELTITFFADSYRLIKNIIFEMRALDFSSLIDVAEASNLLPLIEDIEQNCLLREELDQKNDIDDLIKTIRQAHLFVHTNTLFGYDLDLLLDSDSTPSEEEGVGLYVKWDLKPGHTAAFVKDLKTKIEKEDLSIDWSKNYITAGRGDYALQLSHNSLPTFLRLMRVIKGATLMGHVRRMTTTPQFEFDESSNTPPILLKDHYLFHDGLSQYCFGIDIIRRLRAELKALMVPKITRERITNMYVMYNDGISDPVLYGYFIELKAFLEFIIDLVDEIKGYDTLMVRKVVEVLEPPITIFEYGYKNRFGQSYLLNEITDYNIEFNGGIQQLVSAYDGAYKSQTALLGERLGRSVAYVAGHPDTVSDLASVRLNYFHLYQPELFASAATHEAANSLINRLGYDPTEKDSELNQMIHLFEEVRKARENEVEDPVMDQAIRYFFIDLVTLYIGFNADFQRFFYWQWVYFLQYAESYRTNGEVNPFLLEGFLARMMLIDQFFNRHSTDGNSSFFFKGKVLPPFVLQPPPSLVEAWEKAMLRLSPRVDRLLNAVERSEMVLEYFYYVQDYTLSLMSDEFVMDAKNHPAQIDQARRDIRKNNRRLYDQIDDRVNTTDLSYLNPNKQQEERYYLFVRCAREEYLDRIAKEIAACFEEGKVFSFHHYRQLDELQKVKNSFFYQALFNGYLMLVQKLCRSQCQLRHRDERGRIKEQPFPSIGLEVDPLGGMFTSNLELRRRYYQYRVLFLKSLWNLSLINKKGLFWKSEARRDAGE